jgi:predicted transport protein
MMTQSLKMMKNTSLKVLMAEIMNLGDYGQKDLRKEMENLEALDHCRSLSLMLMVLIMVMVLQQKS